MSSMANANSTIIRIGRNRWYLLRVPETHPTESDPRLILEEQKPFQINDPTPCCEWQRTKFYCASNYEGEYGECLKRPYHVTT